MTLANDILNGHYDDDLDAIKAAAEERQRSLRAFEVAQLTDGDYVELDGISPKYLQGARGHVAGRRKERIGVRLEDDALKIKARKYTTGDGVVYAPAQAIRKVG